MMVLIKMTVQFDPLGRGEGHGGSRMKIGVFSPEKYAHVPTVM